MAERQNASERRTLWIVRGLNIGLAIVFFASGAFGDSSALIANGLDNLSDSFVYVISLFALSLSAKWKRGQANVSGGLLIPGIVQAHRSCPEIRSTPAIPFRIA